MEMPAFRSEITEVHHAIEVPIPLLLWMDHGGFLRINDNDQRKSKIFDSLCSVVGINSRYIEYNGHFGPYVYFASSPEDSQKVIDGVRNVLRSIYRQMVRSKAYRQWVAEHETKK